MSEPEKIYINPNNIDRTAIKNVASMIREGGIVGLPTETVYGLAANMNRKDTLERLYNIKGRILDKPSTVHIGSLHDADFFISILPTYGYRLIEKFWPGPLTIIYYQKSQPGTVGLRCPDHPVTSMILQETLCRVVMPSANVTGKPPAVSAQQVEEIFDGRIDLIVDSLAPKLKVSSTIVDLTQRPFLLVRQGYVSREQIQEVVDTKRVLFVCTGNTCRSIMAEYLFRSYLKKKRPDLAGRIEVFSCGVGALEGYPASEKTQQLLTKEGIDASNHKSKKVNRYLIRSSDIIIVMEKRQRDMLVRMENYAMPRVFLMSSFLKDYNADIPDPIGQGEEVFQESFDLIKEAVVEIIDWL